MPFLMTIPTVPVEPAPSPCPGIEEMTWTDVHGRVWDLLSASSPVRALPGVRGLGVEQRASYDAALTSLDGQRHKGSRAAARDVFWPVLIRGASTHQFLELDDAWWAGLDADTPGVWAVRACGRTRRLTCRWASTEDSLDRDPLRAARVTYGVYLVADDPWWRGETVSKTFINAAPYSSWFGSSSVFQFSSSNTLASASVDNAGDVPAWVDWRITGPASSVTVGVGAATIQFGAVGSGEVITITSTPGRQAVRDGTGASRLTSVASARFAPVPPGASVPLTVTAADTTPAFSVVASLTPGWRKAWGERG